MKSDPQSTPFVVATCKACGTRIDEIAERHPKQVPCPDCFTMVTVPSISQAKAASEISAAPDQPPDPGIYRLVLQPVEVAANGAKTAPPRKREFLVVCPICTARLHVEPRSEVGQIRCPDCLEFVRVPSQAEADVIEAKRAVPNPVIPSVPALPVPKPHKRKRLRTSFDRAKAAIRKEKIDPPPKWVYFSSVWEFPWSKGVLGRWIFMSIGLMALHGIYATIMYILNNAQGMAIGGIAFFVLPGIWIGIWTYSYGTSIWITVLEDTASGNERIHNWLQQNWREWVIEAARFTLIVGLACAVAHAVGWIARLAGGDYAAAGFAALFIVFPIMMLSALHAGSVFAPLTLTILRSLLGVWRAWLMYYLLSGLLLMGWGALWWYAMGQALIATAVLGGPGWAAAWLIWARLLGRLGYAISVKEHERMASSE